MTTDGGASAKCMTDPIAVIVEVVGRVDPEMDPEIVAAAVREVTTTRAGRRKLAKALESNPSLLTSGRTEGPPMVDRLIRTLRDRGAAGVVQPCCSGCGKPARAMRARNGDGLRICVTCHNKALGSFAPRPCAVCGREVTPRFYDRHGQPRCGQCPPDPGVDHLEVICDLILAVSSDSDRDQIRTVIARTVRQAARRRRIAWDLQDRPTLLTGEAADGPLAIRRLIAALTAHGVTSLITPSCPFCTMIRPLKARREGRMLPFLLSSCSGHAVRAVQCGQARLHAHPRRGTTVLGVLTPGGDQQGNLFFLWAIHCGRHTPRGARGVLLVPHDTVGGLFALRPLQAVHQRPHAHTAVP